MAVRGYDHDDRMTSLNRGYSLATALATKAMNAAGADGWFYGNAAQLWNQIIGILAAGALGFALTFTILTVLERTKGLRVTDEEAGGGLDLSQHSDTAYSPGASALRDR
ncbi:MAG TPA: hypothetical protein VLK82_09430 [Candidatus Tectomicrobia bacterium]|nr:hypothetical protein [Candidatus Tectomicrobia bacterium]